jgi:Spy/CpxP family protein refolding chaperone
MQGFDFHSVTPRARRLALATTAALAMACAATVAYAEPGGGMRHGMHGMHGVAPIDQLVPQLLEEAKASLNLNTSQQALWDSVVAQGATARDQGRANRQQVKNAIKLELAKPEPDLAAIADIADSVQQQNRSLRQKVRTQWLALYATFSSEQKAIVRDLLQQRLARAESFRERMHERMRNALRPAG